MLLNIEVEIPKEMTHCMEGIILSVQVTATASMKILEKFQKRQSLCLIETMAIILHFLLNHTLCNMILQLLPRKGVSLLILEYGLALWSVLARECIGRGDLPLHFNLPWTCFT